MSWRHADETSAAAQRPQRTAIARQTTQRMHRSSGCGRSAPSISNGTALPRLECLEELPRVRDVELWIGRLDAQEEPVAAREGEARNVEHRVIRLRQPVQREHAEHRGE